jgi:hypothetical protein
MDDTTIGEAGRKDRAASSIRGLAVNAEGKGPMMPINIVENDKWKGKALYGGIVSGRYRRRDRVSRSPF